MTKAKAKAKFSVPDGAGGLKQVKDYRFDQGDWPIRFEVPEDEADAWLQYLSAESRRRGWSSAGSSQLEAKENSGSITITTRGEDPPGELVII